MCYLLTFTVSLTFYLVICICPWYNLHKNRRELVRAPIMQLQIKFDSTENSRDIFLTSKFERDWNTRALCLSKHYLPLYPKKPRLLNDE